MDAIMGESGLALRSGPAIIIGNRDLARVRSIIQRHAGGVDAASAERLQAELDHAIVVPQSHVPSNIVGIGSKVVIENLTAGYTREVVLAQPEDAYASRGLISVLAPLGSAILGAAEGETVLVERPRGQTSDIRIVAVVRNRGAA